MKHLDQNIAHIKSLLKEGKFGPDAAEQSMEPMGRIFTISDHDNNIIMLTRITTSTNSLEDLTIEFCGADSSGRQAEPFRPCTTTIDKLRILEISMIVALEIMAHFSDIEDELREEYPDDGRA